MNRSVIRKLHVLRHPPLKFTSVGVVNTLLSLTLIFTLKSAFGVGDVPANFSGYIVGLACSFMLNKRWTFESKDRYVPALLRFLLVFGVSYLLNIAVVLGAIQAGANDYLAHLTGIPVYSIVFYLGCRHFAFSVTQEFRHYARYQARSDAAEQERSCWFIGVMVFAASVLLYRLSALPIEVWDEARLANSALEMAQSGLSLITTYDGLPDRWNTKPPLAVWLMSLSIWTFGANEFAVRLPSALSGIATAAMLFGFCAYRLKRPFAGFLSVALLLATPGYVLFHAARSADYDAMLALWTTGYLLAAYMYLHGRPSHRNVWLALCASGVLLAFFTKTIQGLIFLPALVLYVLLQRRSQELLRSRGIYVSAFLVAAAWVLYYVVRDYLDPGYFAAAQENDIIGRYSTAIENHAGRKLFYLLDFKNFPWTVVAPVIAAYQVWRSRDERRQLCLFLGLASLFYLLVVSSASTRLTWYALPLSPLNAIIVAIAVEQLLEAWSNRAGAPKQAANRTRAVAAAIAGMGVFAAYAHLLKLSESRLEGDELTRYNIFLRGPVIPDSGVKKLVVVHPGYVSRTGDKHYFGPPLFYVNVLRAEGRTILLQPPSARIPADFDAVAFCGDAVSETVRSKVELRTIMTDGACGVYGVSAR